MVIVKIIGGLGNQMFQYATARAIAYRNKTSIKLDLSDFATYEHHDYSLGHFNIIEDIAKPEELARFKKYEQFLMSVPSIALKILKKLKLDRKILILGHYMKEYNFPFNQTIKDLKEDVYLDGYWQSEKYFYEIRDILKKEFSIKGGLSPEGAEIASIIQSVKNPICLHIRRGDFANNPEQAKYHGLCSMEYYYKAVEIVAEKVSDPHFFVFSDSIDWVRQNLKLDYPITFVGQGASKNYEDITLMSLCKHHILSNSTFGWWGAWLGETFNQMVIAPNKWFNKPVDIRDLMPKRWITLLS
mgnify:CR=1 FL=1